MSKGQMLRALVNQRLTAAAEEIFVLFERTIAEYEEELCRSKDENQRTQELLDSVLGPSVVLFRPALLTTSVIPGPCQDLNQEITTQIKAEQEEQGFKREAEQKPESAPEASVGVKREEPSKTEHTEEETRLENNSSEPHSHTETQNSDTENDGGWRAPLSCVDVEMDSLWADEDHYTQVQSRDRAIVAQNSDVSWGLSPRHKSAPVVRVTVNNMVKPGTSIGDELKKHQCFVCHKRFRSKQHLQTHIRVHTGEKPYVCSVCNRRFGDFSALKGHMRIHTGERPFSCSFCKKTFTQSANLHSHVRTHTGIKPFSCSTCKKTFSHRGQLNVHNLKNHQREEPSSFSV